MISLSPWLIKKISREISLISTHRTRARRRRRGAPRPPHTPDTTSLTECDQRAVHCRLPSRFSRSGGRRRRGRPRRLQLPPVSQPPATNTGSPAALPPPYPARPPCGPLLLKRRSALRAARLRVRAARCAALARPAPPPLARVCTSTSQQPPHRPGSRIPRAIPTTLPDSTASAAGPNTNLAEIRSEPSFPSPHFYHDIPRVKAPVATGTVPTHPNLLSWGPATHTIRSPTRRLCSP